MEIEKIDYQNDNNFVEYTIGLIFSNGPGKYTYPVTVLGKCFDNHLVIIGFNGSKRRLYDFDPKFLGMYHITEENNIKELVFSDFEKFVNKLLVNDIEQKPEFEMLVEKFKRENFF